MELWECPHYREYWQNTLVLIFVGFHESLEPLSEGGDSNLGMRRLRGARSDQLLPRAAAALQAGARCSRWRIPLPTLQQDHHLNKQVRIPYRTSDIPVPYNPLQFEKYSPLNGSNILYLSPPPPPPAVFPSLPFLSFVQYVLFPLVSLSVDIVHGHFNDWKSFFICSLYRF